MSNGLERCPPSPLENYFIIYNIIHALVYLTIYYRLGPNLQSYILNLVGVYLLNMQMISVW